MRLTTSKNSKGRGIGVLRIQRLSVLIVGSLATWHENAQTIRAETIVFFAGKLRMSRLIATKKCASNVTKSATKLENVRRKMLLSAINVIIWGTQNPNA